MHGTAHEGFGVLRLVCGNYFWRGVRMGVMRTRRLVLGCGRYWFGVVLNFMMYGRRAMMDGLFSGNGLRFFLGLPGRMLHGGMRRPDKTVNYSARSWCGHGFGVAFTQKRARKSIVALAI